MKRTNEQILKRMLRELDTIEAAILRERISKICEITLAEIDKWPNNAAFFISNDRFKIIIEKIQSLLEFENQKKEERTGTQRITSLTSF